MFCQRRRIRELESLVIPLVGLFTEYAIKTLDYAEENKELEKALNFADRLAEDYRRELDSISGRDDLYCPENDLDRGTGKIPDDYDDYTPDMYLEDSEL
jgi:hypothetical protein